MIVGVLEGPACPVTRTVFALGRGCDGNARNHASVTAPLGHGARRYDSLIILGADDQRERGGKVAMVTSVRRIKKIIL